jgi:hypothetical protein
MLWIRIDFGRLDPDPDPSGQRGPQKSKKGRNFMFEVLKLVFFVHF